MFRYLPAPTGRLKFSWNPFTLGSQICGPEICCCIFCVLLSAVFVLLAIYAQPVLNVIIWIIFGILKLAKSGTSALTG